MTKSNEAKALEIHQLNVNYDQTPALWDINLQIPKGKLVGVIGPNGAGKSTLVKSILGIIPIVSGRIEFFGQPLAAIRNEIGYVPQRESVDWDFPINVEDLVLMGRYGHLGLFHWPGKSDKIAAHRYLDMVGMKAYAKRQIGQLSGGQQQRVFIARALMQEASIYFMDEPFAGIDLATEKMIIDILRNLRDDGKTIFVVHHDLHAIEEYFDWVIMLNMRLVTYGEVHQVFNPDTLNNTFGKSYALFGEALKLSQNKTTGRT